jgi:hypothetical protein
MKASHIRTIWKVTSSEPLTKQAMREKKVLYTRNTYILKLLLSVVNAGIVALTSCVKEACCL